VAHIIEKSLAMFEPLLGTWIPFCLIFASTYLIGLQDTEMTTEILSGY